MKTEIFTLNKDRNVTLTAYIQDVAGKFDYIPKRPAVLILPGGAYMYCSDREADPVAMRYLAAGFQVFILRYSVASNMKWPNPLNDYDDAMMMIKEKSNEWGLYDDKIAVVGFSAGGHLAAAAATMAQNRPNAAILGYPVTGPNVLVCNQTAPNVNLEIDRETPPCFIFAARDDDSVSVRNSVNFMEGLINAGITFESHIYSYGGHGFSTCDRSVENPKKPGTDRRKNWVNDSIEWLFEIFGEFGQGKLEEAKITKYLNEDSFEGVSVNCSVQKLLGNHEAALIVEPILKLLSDKAHVIIDDNIGIAEEFKDAVFANILRGASYPEDEIVKLNEKLKQI